MKAAIIKKFGSPEVLEIVADYPQPTLKSNQVLVKVHAASVNPIDWKIRKGDMKLFLSLKLPKILGSDISGEVMETGRKVTGLKKGDLVFGFSKPNRGGAYAQYIALDESALAIKPDSLSFEEAATFPLASLTAYQALVYKGGIKPGALVLINGAAGGVGSFAVQIAKAFGALVTGVSSSNNSNLVSSLGADVVIDYNKTDIRNLDENYDIIFDAVAKYSFEEWKKNLSPQGSFITTIPKPKDILKSITLPFKRLLGNRQKFKFVMVKPSGDDLRKVAELVKNEKIRAVIDKTFSLEEIAEAHYLSETGRAKGKIAITIN